MASLNPAWRGLTEDQVASLSPLSPFELEEKLAEICCCTKYKISLNEACILDYYVSAFWFAIRQANFTAVQVVEFFGLMKRLLENVRDQQMSMTQNIIEMRNVMVKHFVESSPNKPTDNVTFFTRQQLKLITDYIAENLFQHYKLYQVLFTDIEPDHCIIQKVTVEVPPSADVPFPPPLDEGMLEDIHNEFITSSTERIQNSDSALSESAEEVKNLKPEMPVIPVKADEDVPCSSSEPDQDTLLNSLKSDKVQQVVRDVSTEVLSEVKNGLQKKLKERETVLFQKITKR